MEGPTAISGALDAAIVVQEIYVEDGAADRPPVAAVLARLATVDGAPHPWEVPAGVLERIAGAAQGADDFVVSGAGGELGGDVVRELVRRRHEVFALARSNLDITDAADADLVGLAHGSAFKNIRPASTMLVVPALIRPEWKVEIEAEAIIEK